MTCKRLMQVNKSPNQLTTATRNAALRFAQASQQALLVRNGNHLLRNAFPDGLIKC